MALFLMFAPLSLSRAQQSAPATNDETQQQEDPRGIRTREFLGLGRMPDARMAAEGAKTFASTCGFCHGENARGASGPDLLRSPVVLDDNQGELIGKTVHEGRPAKGMPAFPSLTGDQLRDLAEYLHLQVELAANRGTYKALNVVTGDAKEELVAEMGAAFLCAIAGIANENTERNTTAYIQNWISRLEEDNRLIVHAAANAQKAVDAILGFSFENTDESAAEKTDTFASHSEAATGAQLCPV